MNFYALYPFFSSSWLSCLRKKKWHHDFWKVKVINWILHKVIGKFQSIFNYKITSICEWYFVFPTLVSVCRAICRPITNKWQSHKLWLIVLLSTSLQIAWCESLNHKKGVCKAAHRIWIWKWFQFLKVTQAFYDIRFRYISQVISLLTLPVEFLCRLSISCCNFRCPGQQRPAWYPHHRWDHIRPYSWKSIKSRDISNAMEKSIFGLDSIYFNQFSTDIRIIRH